MKSEASSDITRIVLLVLVISALLVGSAWTLLPFPDAMIWATTLAIATWPVLLRLEGLTGGRRPLAAAIMMIARMAGYAAMFGGVGGRSDNREGANPIALLLMMLLAPLAAVLIQAAISRSREFAADATAAKYCGTPDGLISGLQKLEGYSKRIPMDASPATAHMFIIKPFSGSAFFKLFSTHPPTEERIAALAALRNRL